MIFSQKEVQAAAEHCLGNKKTKYNPDVHIPLLMQLFAEGKSIAEFCFKALVTQKTFHQWVNTHPLFETAYELALCAAQVVWDFKGENKEINTAAWTIIMKNRFSYSEERKLSIPKIKGAKTFDEHYKIIMEHLADGNLTGKEANQLAALLASGLKIVQGEEIQAIKEEMIRLAEVVGAKKLT